MGSAGGGASEDEEEDEEADLLAALGGRSSSQGAGTPGAPGSQQNSQQASFDGLRDLGVGVGRSGILQGGVRRFRHVCAQLRGCKSHNIRVEPKLLECWLVMMGEGSTALEGGMRYYRLTKTLTCCLSQDATLRLQAHQAALQAQHRRECAAILECSGDLDDGVSRDIATPEPDCAGQAPAISAHWISHTIT